MRTFTDSAGFNAWRTGRACTVTVGAFDGLHLGHQALLARTLSDARARGRVAVVFTFPDHPLATLAPPHAPPRILENPRRAALLAEAGIDALLEIPFTSEFAAITPEAFEADILADHCGAARVVCGHDFSYGRAGAGDVSGLRSAGGRLGFDVDVVEAVSLDGTPVKSTMIRDLVLQGDVERAARLLTRPHELSGIVVTGAARGRTIGFPTANLATDPRMVAPGRGVYLAEATVEPGDGGAAGRARETDPRFAGRSWRAMVNIGFSPTFGATERPRVEAHLLDFDADLVGRRVRLRFMKRIRDERTFDGVDALAAQLRDDEKAARA